ncbi:MAG: formate/nitrite transporter family protein [Bacteroidaceae bacterium]|nr:formate/nitrite transporter family protein [Bacteroidaceae bacterium]
MKHFISTLRSSILAGVCVGLAGFGYLAEKSIIGAVVFSFGLLAVVAYRLKLYTGTAGFFRRGEFRQLMFILFGNIVGCLLVGLLARCSPMPIQETAQAVLEARLANGPLFGGLLAVGCGFIMTTVVTFARKGNVLPLLFGIPLFINCGFPHCVADAFYYLCVPVEFLCSNFVAVLVFYLSIVAGNFVGCNLYRVVMRSEAIL